MNKADVVDRVVETVGVARQQVEGVLDAFFDTVKSAVREGDRVGWPNFGAFSLSERKARTGRNPQTGEPVDIPASKAVKFTAGSALKGYLNPAPTAGKKAAAKKAAGAGKAAGGRKTAAPTASGRGSDAQKSTAASKDAAKKSAVKATRKATAAKKR